MASTSSGNDSVDEDFLSGVAAGENRSIPGKGQHGGVVRLAGRERVRAACGEPQSQRSRKRSFDLRRSGVQRTKWKRKREGRELLSDRSERTRFLSVVTNLSLMGVKELRWNCSRELTGNVSGEGIRAETGQ